MGLERRSTGDSTTRGAEPLGGRAPDASTFASASRHRGWVSSLVVRALVVAILFVLADRWLTVEPIRWPELAAFVEQRYPKALRIDFVSRLLIASIPSALVVAVPNGSRGSRLDAETLFAARCNWHSP